MTQSQPSLEARGVALGYRKGADLLRDVSLTISAGELVGLVGANGVGKSSLLHVLAGLRPPSAGEILLHGRPFDRDGGRDRARKLAYLPQNRLVHWPIRVRDLVTLGRLPYRRPFAKMSPRDIEAVENALAMTDTAQFGNRRADTLSGGELARVLLARALAQTPTILLADEPIAALDPAYQFRILNLLRKAVDRGIAVLAVFHDLAMATRYCDRLILLHEGGLFKTGTPREVLTARTVETVYGVTVRIFETDGTFSVLPIGLSGEPGNGSLGQTGIHGKTHDLR